MAGSITDNGRILRNLIQGANYVQSHILHFYQLGALDYVDVAAADCNGSDPTLEKVKDFIGRGHLGPFVPRYMRGLSPVQGGEPSGGGPLRRGPQHAPFGS